MQKATAQVQWFYPQYKLNVAESVYADAGSDGFSSCAVCRKQQLWPQLCDLTTELVVRFLVNRNL